MTNDIICDIMYTDKDGVTMEINYKKQPEKYLRKTDRNTYKKIIKAIEGLLTLRGDIIQMHDSELYRLKIHHYRIIFAFDSDNSIITIEEINSRGDVYK